MAAIKKLVFEEEALTLPQLAELLKNDWSGEDGELMRLRFLCDAPKFGNNDDYVDQIAASMVEYFVKRGEYHAKKYPDIYFTPSIGTYSWVISIGKKIGASADGRKSREPIAANLSPAPGRDLCGPTAAINSYLKLDTRAMAAGAPLDLRLSGNGLGGEAGTRRIAALIKTFLQRGGNMLTLTVASADELKKAIADPGKYRGLRVRMGGWSAYFVLLSKESQKLHLKRAEHGLP
jgi:formate C-acetyltransferase